MGRAIVNLLENSEKEATPQPRKSLLGLTPSERLLLLALRLWASNRRLGNSSHARGEWRQVFLASLEPARSPRGEPARTAIAEGASEDALADFDGFLAVLVSAPEHTWRFHHPRCIGIDADEGVLLNLLRLAQRDDRAAGMTLLRGFIAEQRADRALRYLGNVVGCLGASGLGLPLPMPGYGDRGLNLTH